MRYIDNSNKFSYEELVALFALAKRTNSKYRINNYVWVNDSYCLICEKVIPGDRFDNPELYRHGRRHISEHNLTAFL